MTPRITLFFLLAAACSSGTSTDSGDPNSTMETTTESDSTNTISTTMTATTGPGTTSTTTTQCVAGAAIQPAIDTQGGPVTICAGIHMVNLVLPDGAVVQGSGTVDSTILDGGSTLPVVRVEPLASITLTGLTLQNGQGLPGTAGGVEALQSAGIILNDMVIQDNTAEMGGLAGPFSGSTTLTDVTVRANSGTSVGGLVVSDAMFTRVVVEGNSGDFAGGVYVLGDQPAVLADADTRVQNNISGYGGGGVTLDMFASWTGGRILGNSADEGGGVMLLNPRTNAVTDVVISGNTARVGGGLFANPCCGDEFSSTVSNVTFELNEATAFGGGVYWSAQGARELVLQDSTVHGNTAPQGGGVYMGGAALLTATANDFGSGATDNAVDIQVEGGVSYPQVTGDFSCDATLGTCTL